MRLLRRRYALYLGPEANLDSDTVRRKEQSPKRAGRYPSRHTE